MIKPNNMNYMASGFENRAISSREGFILFLIIIALVAAVCGSIITP